MQHVEGNTKTIAKGSHITMSIKEAGEELSDYLSLVSSEQNKEAFTKLFQFFAPKIKRFGIKQHKDVGQANELVQETMTNVWKKAHLYDQSKGAATTWVYSVMRNASFDLLRKNKGHMVQDIGDDIWSLEQAAQENETSSLSPLADHLMTKQLKKVVNDLPEAQRVILEAVYFQEVSQEQLSKQLGIPIGTIKSRLRLALEKIRQKMGDQDHD
jgi:RNA polymerase sigma-70 factor (ECF subfamily)